MRAIGGTLYLMECLLWCITLFKRFDWVLKMNELAEAPELIKISAGRVKGNSTLG
jgi:hypothetical protein